MSTTALSRNGDAAPSTSESATNGHTDAKDNSAALVEGTDATENGHAAEKGNDTPIEQSPESGTTTLNGMHRQWERRMARVPSSSHGDTTAVAADGSRPALAVFCWENPDTLIGRCVAKTVAALARRHKLVHLFSRQPFGLSSPDLREHPVGDCAGVDLFEQVREFTSRAANAFLHEFPGGSPHVTLMGYEWSGAGPLGLLRGLKNNRTIFSVDSLERQRSDMTSEISKRIDELEANDPARVAGGPHASSRPPSTRPGSGCPSVPGSSSSLAGRSRPSSLKASSMPARSRAAIKSARSIRPSCSSAT